MGTVLVTDGVHPVMFEGLHALGFETEYQPDISLSELHEVVHQYQGLVINSKIIVDKSLLDKTKDLVFVARLGSGMEIIDQPYCKEKGVHVISAPEGNRNAVAEHALGMLLALANKFIQSDKEVRAKHWDREKNRGFELMGKTIGLIGFGHTGSSFAKKLAGMEMEVLAYDKYKTDYTHPFPFVTESTLSEIKKKADIISFHLPLNPETKYYCNKDFINNCKDGVVLINTSRGNVIKTGDLIEGLNSGKVGGACLDVFENEKPNTFSKEEHELFGKLYAFPNTILSPHVAGWTVESKRRLSEVILRKLKGALFQ